MTSSVTPAPAPDTDWISDFLEVFRYVRHADVPRFTAEGWELLPALDGTHHGEYSCLCAGESNRIETAPGRPPGNMEETNQWNATNRPRTVYFVR